MRIGFIGAGSMASALARGLGEPALVYDVQPQRAEALASELGGSVVASNAELAGQADLVILAHKPAQLQEVAREVDGRAKTVASIVAATRVAQLEAAYPGVPVYRFIPNIPVEVGRGVFCYAPGALAAEGPQEQLLRLFGRCGVVIPLDEPLIEPAMALMSCGPAFLALALEAMADAGDAAAEQLADARTAAAEQLAKVKPRLRGVSHEYAFFVSLLGGAGLIVLAKGFEARLAVAIYAVSLSALFGVSALYHRVDWRRPESRRWMRRLDHSAIFLVIAGSYTPFALLVIDGALADVILVVIWSGAAVGIFLKLVWIDAPKWLVTLIYLALGWVIVVAAPDLFRELGVTAASMVALGGVLYTAGAVVYALKRPDPVADVFGYHEVFHVLVILAAALQYAVIAFWVLPGG